MRAGALGRAAVVAAAVTGTATGLGAQSGGDGAGTPPQFSTSLQPGDTVLATPVGRYEAGAIHRSVMGRGWRELWSTPIPVPVLDLEAYAGGLEPLRLGGGQQTRSLRLRGEDGRIYNFRSVDKDAARTLDPVLRETLAARVLQDQVSALFPLSAMVVAPLLQAAGILHPHPELVVMPDDPALGEWREEFVGMLGWIEERPDEGEAGDPGFADSRRVVGSERLLERLEEGPGNRIDARAFLRARLMDALVGDWDRHPDQWRWAGFPAGSDGEALRFEPVPRDRDWALSRLGGLVSDVAVWIWPHYVGFSEDYPSAFRLTWSARALDRRLLSELEWEEWEAVVEELMAGVSEEAVRGAVGRLPGPYREAVGDELLAALLARRTGLPDFAREFYELLAGAVDVHVTDEDEAALVEWLDDGRLRVTVEQPDGGSEAGEEPFFGRTFLASETREVRIYLHGGADRAVVRGRSDADTKVRVVGGGADDELVDVTTGSAPVYFYDHQGDNTFVTRDDTRVDEREWETPEDWRASTHQAPPRDWGHRWLPLPALAYEPDVGLLVGAGARRIDYGFRHYPWETNLSFSLALGTTTGKPSARVVYDFPVRRELLRGRVGAELVGAEAAHFYGFGNESDAEPGEDFFEARRQGLEVGGELSLLLRPELSVSLGADVLAFRPEGNPGTFIEELDPYGFGDFERIALGTGIRWDVRDHASQPRSGGFVELDGRWAPGALDVVESYGGLKGVAATYLSSEGPLRPTLALRVGGERWWGRLPYFDAAYLGDADNLRGYRSDRFAGRGAVFANAELRLFLTEFVFLLPGDLGLVALADVGRVFAEGESSDRWHPSVGGGIQVSFLDEFGFSAVLARGDEDTLFYFSLGSLF